MTDREYALNVLTQQREAASMVLAQEAAAADFARLGLPVSPRTLAGAISDAGDLGGYETVGAYQIALGEFVAARLRHGRRTFDLPGQRQ